MIANWSLYEKRWPDCPGLFALSRSQPVPGPFKEARQEEYRRCIEEGCRFTDSEIYQTFIDRTPADKVSRLNSVIVRFHGGDLLESG